MQIFQLTTIRIYKIKGSSIVLNLRFSNRHRVTVFIVFKSRFIEFLN